MVEVPAAALAADRFAPRGRLLLDRHQRPRAVHDGGRARQRGARAAARRARSRAVLRLIAARHRGRRGARALGRRLRRARRRPGGGRPARGPRRARARAWPPSRIPEVKAGAARRSRSPSAASGRRRWTATTRRPAPIAGVGAASIGRLVASDDEPVSGIRSARFLAAGTSLRIVLTPVVMALLPGRRRRRARVAAAVLFASPRRPTGSTATSRAAGRSRPSSARSWTRPPTSCWSPAC